MTRAWPRVDALMFASRSQDLLTTSNFSLGRFSSLLPSPFLLTLTEFGCHG